MIHFLQALARTVDATTADAVLTEFLTDEYDRHRKGNDHPEDDCEDDKVAAQLVSDSHN